MLAALMILEFNPLYPARLILTGTCEEKQHISSSYFANAAALPTF